jgi:phospholipase A1
MTTAARSYRVSRLLMGFALLAMTGSLTCQAQPKALEKCHGKHDDAERFKCYDDVSGYNKQAKPVAPVSDPVGKPSLESTPKPQPDGGKFPTRGRLASQWLLGETDGTPLTKIQEYRPVYFITTWASDVNAQPSSPGTGLVSSRENVDSQEVKFQLSFKSEVISPQTFSEFGLSKKWRLWFAYTQTSFWQLYNGARSSPFRETNYEPEFILTYNTYHAGNELKLVNLGFVHQSNGQSLPESRSWNRIYLQGGWDFGARDNPLSVLGRVWWRVPEDAAKDDNPQITDYVGRGDVVLRYNVGEQNKLSLLARHNLRFSPSRGFLQFDWATQGFGAERKNRTTWYHLQLAYGYGESLIDYNFKQKRIGLGVSFGDW